MGRLKNGIPCFLPRTSSMCAFSSFTGKHGDTFSLWSLHPIPPLQFHPVGKITQKMGRWRYLSPSLATFSHRGHLPACPHTHVLCKCQQRQRSSYLKEVQVHSGRKSELLKKQICQVKLDRLRRKKLSKSRGREKWGGEILSSVFR